MDKYKLKIAQLEDKLLREQADFQNIKRRLLKEKNKEIELANERFAKELLLTIDNLERALETINLQGSKETLKTKEGIELTLKGLLNTFGKNGIKIIETEEFNPEIHEAMAKVDSKEHNSGEIVNVIQKGYLYKNRLLRPSMVSIAN